MEQGSDGEVQRDTAEGRIKVGGVGQVPGTSEGDGEEEGGGVVGGGASEGVVGRVGGQELEVGEPGGGVV